MKLENLNLDLDLNDVSEKVFEEIKNKLKEKTKKKKLHSFIHSLSNKENIFNYRD